jgi:dTDP-4-dehydrorhamnose reductase/dTDP-4-dehydrorhamnose 3,5-epimerase
MKKIETELKDCYILEPDRFGDDRGYFSPYFIDKNLEELGFKKVVQANRSKSAKGVVRGLHFQQNPKCQAKIVEVIKGSAIDVVVDIRKDSPTYGKFTAVKLTDENNRQLFVPRGFAHGFISLEDDTIFQYLIDNDYAPKMEGGILWNDPDLGINWDEMFKENGIEKPLLSDKDQIHPQLKDNKVEIKRDPEKYLITGYKGQLGYDIKRELLNNGIKEENILAIDKDEMDITNRDEVMKVVKDFNPDVIFQCAAWTAVDKAEDEKDLCYKVNVEGTKNLVDASIATDSKIVYLSTDYVFDGKKDLNELYETDDKTNPMSVYGLTKYQGEEEVRRNPKHFITRISWVFGINGNNFIKTMLKLSDNHKELNVVDDQIGSPTYTVDLAHLLVNMAETSKYGTYHANNEGFTSWADFAEYIFKINDKDVKVNHVSTEEYINLTGAKQAYRPRNSKLSKDSLDAAGFDRLPTWEDATERYCEELTGKKLTLKKENK